MEWLSEGEHEEGEEASATRVGGEYETTTQSTKDIDAFAEHSKPRAMRKSWDTWQQRIPPARPIVHAGLRHRRPVLDPPSSPIDFARCRSALRGPMHRGKAAPRSVRSC